MLQRSGATFDRRNAEPATARLAAIKRLVAGGEQHIENGVGRTDGVSRPTVSKNDLKALHGGQADGRGRRETFGMNLRQSPAAAGGGLQGCIDKRAGAADIEMPVRGGLSEHTIQGHPSLRIAAIAVKAEPIARNLCQRGQQGGIAPVPHRVMKMEIGPGGSQRLGHCQNWGNADTTGDEEAFVGAHRQRKAVRRQAGG